ncbi:hypothetical protein CS063_12480 [Sporanaerobium hydrogeniformans]|uniref:Uncharacterized protein n=1 Tax=Sporanaerobium hydrogeniformans TaxID=3072179 RepID=A0AC61DAP4_9FIRM|nr:superoxide dismutase [Sporanaerobium hydrogeniformans]PHV70113.1 hypothetical protein CS063_12480 [Sporanaerobium hydrogeniformans]
MNKLASLALLSLTASKRHHSYVRTPSTSHIINPRTDLQDLAPCPTCNNGPTNAYTSQTPLNEASTPPPTLQSTNVVVSTNPYGSINYVGAGGETPYIIYTRPLYLEGSSSYAGPKFSTDAILSTPTLGNKDAQGHFILPPLNYDYSALEPFIDTETMKIHYTKHHQKYISDLNNALVGYPELNAYTLEELLTSSDTLPAQIRSTVTDTAGGNYNHSFFWKNLSPKSKQLPQSNLRCAINRDFGSIMDWRFLFKQVALSVFGSGWVWLVTDANGKLLIVATANQNTPLPLGLKPLIVLDLWEHAYYLKHQNQRGNYIDNWFNVVNWEKASELYDEALSREISQ